VPRLRGSLKNRESYKIALEILQGAVVFYSLPGISRTQARERKNLLDVDQLFEREGQLQKGESRFYDARYAVAPIFKRYMVLVDRYAPALEGGVAADFKNCLRRFKNH